MKEINIPKSANGFIYTIKSVEKTTISCPKSCSYIEDKDYDCWYVSELRRKGIKFNRGVFECIKVVINVKNIGNYADWSVSESDAILVDTDGFSYNGLILCEDCLPPRTVSDGTDILPHTQVNYIQLFPTLDHDIAKLKININGEWVDYILNEDMKDPFENIEVVTQRSHSSNSVISQNADIFYSHGEDYNNQWQLDKFTERVNRLKTNIYSRLNNILNEQEKIKLDNKINNELYSLKLDLQSKQDSTFDEMIKSIQTIESEYRTSIQNQHKVDEVRQMISQKVDNLLELSPREFEEYIGELFSNMGYTVEVTQYSNDKGIDIIMYKDDIKYGVQCKRYKGTVGSPEIQTFIGALSHAKADKGFFVTTGMFSFEAEKMAVQHPIQLVNRIDLAKLILEVLNS